MNNPLRHLSNLNQRIIVGVLGILLFIGLIFSGIQGTLTLFSIIVALSLFEFYSLSTNKIPNYLKWIGTLIGLFIFGLGLCYFQSVEFSLLPIFLIISPILLILLIFMETEKPFESASWLVFGWFYLISPWLCMLMIMKDQVYNPWICFGLFGLLWASDSGAYAAGRTLGKTKLLPTVSPKKTWEGLVGGMVSAGLIAWILAETTQTFTLFQWLCLAISTVIFGTLGDLAESRLKRSLDIKDSGTILPGHGGILDRFDGLFVAAPINAALVHFFF